LLDPPAWSLVLRSLVVGVLGGAGLILTQAYSRRGPLIFPVYAALLAALAFLSARFVELPYAARFAAALSGVLLASAMALIGVLVIGGRERRRLVESGRPMAPGRAPAWALPLVLIILVVVSAAVAYVSS
jgi:hypothetical protein